MKKIICYSLGKKIIHKFYKIMKIARIQKISPLNHRINATKTKKQKPNFTGKFGIYDFSYEYGHEQFASNFWNMLQDNKKGIYSHFDKSAIEFEKHHALLLKHLEGLFQKGSKSKKEYKLLHKTHHSEEILREGFDVTKISQTKYGPGIYFSGSEGALQIYSGITLLADFQGTGAIGDNLEKYEKLVSTISPEIRNFLGMGFEYTPTIMTEYHVLKKFCDEFARNLIVNKLNIDGATCSNSGYFVVFNPNSLYNIRKY